MRRRSPDRLDQLIAAALRVFGDKGYHRTQMADIASAMGVAPGTLYSYVTGKDALFHLVIDRAFASDVVPAPAFPVPSPPPGATLGRLRERLAQDTALPALEAAVSRRRTADTRAELEAVVRELYAMIERAWPGIVVLERSALDLPELAQAFYGEARGGVLRRLERYLAQRMRTRRLRAASPPAAARFVVESIAWFAMHRHRDPLAHAIDDSTARETAVDLIVNALTGRDSSRPRPRKETRR